MHFKVPVYVLLASIALNVFTKECPADQPNGGLEMRNVCVPAVEKDGQALNVEYMRCSAMPVNTRWPGHQRELDQTEICGFVRFDLAGGTELCVRPGRPFREAVVRPVSKRVAVRRDGDAVRFTLTEPGAYSVEFDGRHRNLMVFADAPRDYSRIDRAAPNVRYFGPGEHEAGVITLKAGETLFLDEGAVVYGRVYAKDAPGIRICGRGILDASRVTEVPVGVDPGLVEEQRRKGWAITNVKRFNTVDLHYCDGARLDGFTIRDSQLYAVRPVCCDDLVIDNIRVLGSWRYNSDGIDMHNCRKVRIRDCFVRTFDDSICVKGFDYCLPESDILHNGVLHDLFEDVLVERCTIWNDWGRALEIGAETRAREIRDVIFRDCDILQYHCAPLDVQNCDQAHVHGIVYENIRVEVDPLAPVSRHAEHARDFDPKRLGGPGTLAAAVIRYIPEYSKAGATNRGRISDVIFRDISVIGPKMPDVYLKGFDTDHCIERVTFQNIRFNGKDVTKQLLEKVDNRGFATCSGPVPFDLANARIEIAADNESVKIAAEEMARHLELISGVRPAFVKAGATIVLGRSPAGEGELGEFEARAAFRGGVLYCWGDDVAKDPKLQKWGTLFGAYGFLEEMLGVRWVNPGDGGIVCDRRTSVDVPVGWRYRFYPPFEKSVIRLGVESGWTRGYDTTVPRELHLTTERLEQEGRDRRRWGLRQRLQIRDDFNFGHAFVDWFKRFHATHPEYLRMDENGRRCACKPERGRFEQPCLSNPAAQEQMIADWIARGTPRYFNLCGNDSTYHCRCENCLKWDADEPGEFFHANKADRHVRFWNVLYERARKVRPDVVICTYAYLDYRKPPRRERIAHPDGIVLGIVPSIYDDMEELLDGWRKAGVRRFVIRPNYLCYPGSIPRGYERYFAQDFKVHHARGMIGVDEDSFNRSVVTDFDAYVLARLIANPDRTFGSIEAEFLSQYGAAAPELGEYYGRVRTRGERERLAGVAWMRTQGGTRDDSELSEPAVRGHTVADMQGDLAVLDRARAKTGLAEAERRRIAAVRLQVELGIRERKVYDAYVPWQQAKDGAEENAALKAAAVEYLEFLKANCAGRAEPWELLLLRPLFLDGVLDHYGLLKP